MKIAVIGDACTDKYIYGSCDRLCPEGPVAVMKSRHENSILYGVIMLILRLLYILFKIRVQELHFWIG